MKFIREFALIDNSKLGIINAEYDLIFATVIFFLFEYVFQS